jgi:hypothetical protein
MIEINLQYDPPLVLRKNHYYALIDLHSIDLNVRDVIINKIKHLKSGSLYIKVEHYKIEIKEIYRYSENHAEMSFYVLNDELDDTPDLIFRLLEKDLIYADKLILLKK